VRPVQPKVAQSDQWKGVALKGADAGIHWRVVCYAVGHSETAEEFDAAIQADTRSGKPDKNGG